MKKILTFSLGLFSTIFSIYSQINTGTYFSEDFENSTRFSQWEITVLSGSSEWVQQIGLPYGDVESAESGNFNACHSSYNYNGDRAMLTSPRIDLSSSVNPVLIFSYVQPAWSIDQDSLKVYYKSAIDSEWIFLSSFNENIEDWTIASIALPDASSDYYIAFEAISGYGYGTGIDNITIEKGEPCGIVSGFEINNVKETSVSLRWIETTCNSFEIEYGQSGFSHGDGIRISGIKANNAIINGLLSGESYDFYIRSYCSQGVSDWSQAIELTTECGIGVVLPYIESFENVANPFECWQINYANADFHPGNEVIAFDSEAYDGELALRFSSFEAGAPYDQFLISPIISVDEFTEFSFMYKAIDGSSEIFYIGYSENESPSEVSVQWSEAITNADDEWQQYISLIPQGTKRIYIHYATQFGYYLYLDKLRIGHPADCDVAESIIVDEVGINYAKLSWDENENIFAVEYGFAGFVKGTGTKVCTNGISNITIENLIAFTQYSFYGLTDCEGSIIYSDAVGFTTIDQCAQISSIALQQVGLDFADISWSTNNQQALFNVEFGTAGFELGSGILFENLTSSEIHFNNLLPNTEYDVYIQAVCPQWDNVALWSEVFSFSTNKKDDYLVDVVIEETNPNQTNNEEVVISIKAVQPLVFLCGNSTQTQHIELLLKNEGSTKALANTKIDYIVEDINNGLLVSESFVLTSDLGPGDTFVFSTLHEFGFESEQNPVSISLSANDLVIKNKTVEVSYIRLSANISFVGGYDDVVEAVQLPFELEAIVNSNSGQFGVEDSFIWSTGDENYYTQIDRLGDFSFTVSNQYCSFTKDITVKSAYLGNPSDDFQIFPNPTHGIITITNVLDGSPVTFDVYDAAGRLVYNETISGPEQTIDLTNLSTGMYSAFFIQDGNSVLKRLFID